MKKKLQTLRLIILFIAGFACGENSRSNPDGVRLPVDITTISTSKPCVTTGESVTYSAEVTKDGESVSLTYEWVFTGANIATSSDEAPTVTYAETGTHSANLTVTGSDKSFDIRGTSIKVKNSCLSVVALILLPEADTTIPQGQSLSFEGAASGGDPAYTYKWFGFNPATSNLETPNVYSEDKTASHVFNIVGVWEVTLTVTDSTGDKAEDMISITVTASSLNIECSMDPNEIIPVDTPYGFAASGVGGSGNYDSWSWDFGSASDIPNSTEQSPTVTFTTTGTHTIGVTVTDSAGETFTKTFDVEVGSIVSVDTPVGRMETIVATPANFGGSAPLTFGEPANAGWILLGLDGAAIFDKESLSFGPAILTSPNPRFFGGAVASPAGGPDTIIFWDFTATYITYHNEGTGLFDTPTVLPGSTKAKDIQSIPGVDSFIIASSGFKIYDFDSGTGVFVLGDEFSSSQFPGATGSSSLAVMRNVDDGFISATSAGEVWYHDGNTANNGTLIGTLDDTLTGLHCLGGICTVVDQTTSMTHIITWDETDSSNVNFANSFPVGTNPRGTNLMMLSNDNIACVVANRNDNSYTITEITPLGIVDSSVTEFTSGPCGSPNDAVWMNDGTADILLSCLSETSVVVLPTDLTP
jgi:PKD repeat protein